MLFVLCTLSIAAAVCTVSPVITGGVFDGLQFVTAMQARAAEKKGPKPSGPPPLVVNRDAPLLLDSPPKEKDPADAPKGKGPVADNTACYVCHDNYQQEPLAAGHAKEDVGCTRCHGRSYAHRNDEDNVTPPDVMYAPEKIAANCRPCHYAHDVAATEVIARWQERCPAKTDPKKIVCTDCHGQHRLKFRTVWWDKKTRKLIVRQGDQRTKTAPDLTKPPLP